MRLAAEQDFATFGQQHAVVLGVFALGLVVAFWAGRRLARRDDATIRRVCRIVAVVFVTLLLGLQVNEWVRDGVKLAGNLPLQICDLVWMVLGVALWTRRRTWVMLGYYWGLTLSLQGVLTPDLHSTWPSMGFISFWAQHLPLVWVAAFQSIGLRQGPTWADYRRCLTITLGWAAVTMTFNALADTNYGFLNYKPKAGSVLDVLGPWPLYVVVEAAIVAIGWALITWPWNRRRRVYDVPGETADSVL